MSERDLKGLYSTLEENLYGHHDFKKTFRDKTKGFRVLNFIGTKQVLSFFLLGPSGVGKTEFARIISRYMDPETPLLKLNFGNYSSHDALNSLIGSPRGYIGSEEGELVSKLKKSNSGVILIDEFEKAERKVFNFFLQLLEEGVFTDSLGAEHNLNGYIVIFTSNLSPYNLQASLPSELLSRFDMICDFRPLNPSDKEAFRFAKVQNLLAKIEKSYGISTEPGIRDTLLSIDISHINDLREIDRVITDSIIRQLQLFR